jgi:hypothetical protein
VAGFSNSERIMRGNVVEPVRGVKPGRALMLVWHIVSGRAKRSKSSCTTLTILDRLGRYLRGRRDAACYLLFPKVIGAAGIISRIRQPSGIRK